MGTQARASPPRGSTSRFLGSGGCFAARAGGIAPTPLRRAVHRDHHVTRSGHRVDILLGVIIWHVEDTFCQFLPRCSQLQGEHLILMKGLILLLKLADLRRNVSIRPRTCHASWYAGCSVGRVAAPSLPYSQLGCKFTEVGICLSKASLPRHMPAPSGGQLGIGVEERKYVPILVGAIGAIMLKQHMHAEAYASQPTF